MLQKYSSACPFSVWHRMSHMIMHVFPGNKYLWLSIISSLVLSLHFRPSASNPQCALRWKMLISSWQSLTSPSTTTWKEDESQMKVRWISQSQGPNLETHSAVDCYFCTSSKMLKMSVSIILTLWRRLPLLFTLHSHCKRQLCLTML